MAVALLSGMVLLLPAGALWAQTLAERTIWQVGRDDLPTVAPYLPAAEFSAESGSPNPPPGQVTRLPGDPVYQANPTGNPLADDDFYFAGNYPAGFNGLAVALAVPKDEPASAWERAHTHTDPTNRVHFTLAEHQTGASARFRLTAEFVSGTLRRDGVTQPGMGTHDLAIRFRNGAGAITGLAAVQVNGPTNVVVEFTGAAAGATPGANTLELVRTGPVGPGIIGWIVYDHLRLEVQSVRTIWQVGRDDPPTATPYLPAGEFSLENGRNDVPPGSVTRLPGDPAYPTNSAANPTADDDFYFAGNYPPGFNGLAAALAAPNDEPASAWEPAHTHADAANRIHFVLTDSQTGPGARFRLATEFASGGLWIQGIPQPGVGIHDLTIRFRNGLGVGTVLAAHRINAPTNILVEFAGAGVNATPGGNTVELVRTGPTGPGVVGWLVYDYLRLELLPPGNAAPLLAAVPDMTVDEGVPLAINLSATDSDLPAQALTFGLVSGPVGMTVTGAGRLAWTPAEVQGPSLNVVRIRVTDNGIPPRASTNAFRVTVLEVNRPPVVSAVPDQTIHDLSPLRLGLTATDLDLPAQALAWTLVRGPQGLTVSPAGEVRWTPEPQFAGTTNVVTVGVADDGSPSRVAMTAFRILVRRVATSADFSVRTVIAAQSSPWDIAWGPDDWLWYTERTAGRVARVHPATGVKQTLLTLGSAMVQTAGQDGLMGLAIHPDFHAGKPFVYLAYTYQWLSSTVRRTRIARYTFNAARVALEDPVTVLEGIPGSDDHNSGRLSIGPDRRLYYTVGDMGAGQFSNLGRVNHAQYPTVYEGKVLRLNLEPEKGSWIPGDNPFTAASGLPTAVFSLGHRNAQGLVWADIQGRPRLYASEHGPFSDDEINLIERGVNYGWPAVIGFCDGNYDGRTTGGFTIGSEADNCRALGVREPLVSLFPSPSPPSDGSFLTWPSVGPSGMDVYSAEAIPGWRHSLLVTTLKNGSILRFKLNEDGSAIVSEAWQYFRGLGRYRDLVVSPDGRSLYVACDSSGTTSGPTGGVITTPPNPGSILEFRYLGSGP